MPMYNGGMSKPLPPGMQQPYRDRMADAMRSQQMQNNMRAQAGMGGQPMADPRAAAMRQQMMAMQQRQADMAGTQMNDMRGMGAYANPYGGGQMPPRDPRMGGGMPPVGKPSPFAGMFGAPGMGQPRPMMPGLGMGTGRPWGMGGGMGAGAGASPWGGGGFSGGFK